MPTPAPLRLAVITAASHLPDLSDADGWNEGLRLRGLIDSLERGGYQIAGVLGADARLPERLAELAPDLLIVDAALLQGSSAGRGFPFPQDSS
jgi:two-component system, response regulator / RNA-binding antiterminator